MAETGVFCPEPGRGLLRRGDGTSLPAFPDGRSILAIPGCGPAALRFVRETNADETSHWRSFVMQVRHILQGKGHDIIAVASSATLQEVARILSDKKIGALVVKEKNGALAGIISERDLVRAVAEKGPGALGETVDNHMTKAPQTCAQSDSVETIMEVMTVGRFRHVPVLDEADRLCGMVSIGDVVKIRIAETVREAAVLRDYISAAV